MTEAFPIVCIGAAGGIGRALCKRLADRSHPLLLIGRRAEGLAELAESLPVKCTVAALDASDRPALQAAVQDFAASVGPPQGMVNLAGSILLKSAQRTTPEAFLEVLQANLVTAFNTIAVAQATMTAGSVVLMSSVAASTGLMNHEAIAAAKAGVEGLVRAAAASGARRGLRVNGVAPALVDTPMAAPLLSNDAARQASARLHPLGRIGTADEVAAAIAFLLDGNQGWISGQILGIDGGMGALRLPS